MEMLISLMRQYLAKEKGLTGLSTAMEGDVEYYTQGLGIWHCIAQKLSKCYITVNHQTEISRKTFTCAIGCIL